MIGTILGEQAQLQQLQEELKEEPAEAFEELQDAPELCVVYGPWRRKEEILPLLIEEGSGKEAVEKPQKIMPTTAAHSTPKTHTTKAIPSALLVQYFRKLVVTIQTFATTSKTLATAHIAWHSGWPIPKPSWFRFGAPGSQQLH